MYQPFDVFCELLTLDSHVLKTVQPFDDIYQPFLSNAYVFLFSSVLYQSLFQQEKIYYIPG